jgi:hypothetical protein
MRFRGPQALKDSLETSGESIGSLRSVAQSRSRETWQAACRINSIVFAAAVLRYGVVLLLHDKKTLLAAIDGH